MKIREIKIQASFIRYTVRHFQFFKLFYPTFIFNFSIFQFSNLSIFLIFQFFNLSIFNSSFAQTQLDQFEYHYSSGSNNRLTHIDDVIDAANSTVDIDDQVEGNYEYNAIGQLTHDEAEGIENIEWHVNGKVSSVTKTDGSIISFTYDAFGNRVTKTLTTHNSQLTTYYLRDAKGNLIARYEQENSAAINLKEFSLYGGSQLGTLETEIDQSATASSDSTFTRTLSTKSYELKDHLGNVRTVVSDIKNSSLNASNTPANFSADITMVSDYYSYGMQMPGRTYQSSNYKYGFQGKEKDDELKGASNSYDFGARLYDPRVGRWLSTDPLESKDPSRSTFCAMADNPIKMIDPDGRAHMAVSEFDATERRMDPPAVAARSGTSAPTIYMVEFDGKTYARKEGESWDEVLRRENEKNNGSGVVLYNGVSTFFTPVAPLVTESEMANFQRNKQFISGGQCADYANYIALKLGNSNPVGDVYRIDVLNDMKPTDDAGRGVDAILAELDAGRSVKVAIDLGDGTSGNMTEVDGQSDHYINITGYAIVEGRLRFYCVENFLWDDPDDASDPEKNYVDLMEDGTLRGQTTYFDNITVTHVRPNIK
jgi:RHS repeat-associated protein